jgi:hypothetical protein
MTAIAAATASACKKFKQVEMTGIVTKSPNHQIIESLNH